MRISLPVLLAVLLITTPCLAADLDLRQLPSLKVAWSVPGEVVELRVADSVAYVLTETAVSAYDAGSGRLLWQVPVNEEGCWDPHMESSGRMLAIATGQQLHLIDRATGSELTSVDLGSRIKGLNGPTLVVNLSEGMESTVLVAVDPETGNERGRWRGSGWQADEEIQLDSVVVVTLQHDGSSDVIALRADALTELWRYATSGYPELHLYGGRLYISQARDPHSCESDRIFQELDLGSGELGTALPARKVSEDWYDRGMELQSTSGYDTGNTCSLRRLDPERTQPVWSVELPGANVGAHALVDTRLFVCVGKRAGRGLLTVLDWDTGEVQSTAYGLDNIRQLVAYEDLLIAAGEEGVVAFSSQEYGPPEAEIKQVSAEVKRILASLEEADFYGGFDDSVAELLTLGEEAAPFLAAALDSASCMGTAAIASVLSELGYRKGAPRLAARLSDMPCTGLRSSSEATTTVLKALAALGGDEQVAPVALILNDSERDDRERIQALATIAAIGTPSAVEAIDSLLKSEDCTKVWWDPPDASPIRDIAGHTAARDRLDEATENDDWEEYGRLMWGERSTRVQGVSGSDLLVFPAPLLGGPGNLWAAEIDSSGAVGAALFLGVSVHNVESLIGRDYRFTAEVSGNLVTIRRTDKPDDPIKVSLAEARRDSDQDGLTDLVEQRLRTDPHSRDSDADGLVDAVDPAPNAETQRPESEEDEIRLAIFRQMHMLDRHSSELAIVVHDTRLEWRGRSGPTITLDAEEDKQFLEEAGYDGVPHIIITPGFDSLHEEEIEQPELPADERAYSLTVYRGGLNAVGYHVIVRKLGQHWVIREMEMTWIS